MPKPLKTLPASTPDPRGGFWTGEKALRVGIYGRVSTHDQKTLPMQLLAMRDYAEKRGWGVAVEVQDVGSGATTREQRETLIEAARRREIDCVLVWRLDRWGRSLVNRLRVLAEQQGSTPAESDDASQTLSLSDGQSTLRVSEEISMETLGSAPPVATSVYYEYRNRTGTVKLSGILGFWRRNRSSVERRINNLGSGQGAD